MRSTNIILLIILFTAIIGLQDIKNAWDVHASSYPEDFHTEGNKIVNDLGTEMIFRGINPIDPVIHALGGYPENGVWGEQHFAKMAEWGATAIRLSIHPGTWRTYGKDASIAVIDEAVQWAGNYNMYVYIDYHSVGFPPTGDYPGGTYNTSIPEIKAFWNDISAHYKDEKIMAFYEIFNEPTLTGGDRTQDWIDWREVAEEIIDTIRVNDPDKPVIVGGVDWAYDLSRVIDYPVRRTNVIYATHPYPGQANWVSWDDAFGNIKEVFPVFATEFGFAPSGQQHAEDNYPGPGLYREEIINYLEERKISWTVWCFSSTWGPSLLSDMYLYTPSESGAFFRSKLLEYHNHILQVVKEGTGSGTAASSPAGIDCGTDCSEEYTYGTAVTLTATSDAGSIFRGWSGDTGCSEGIVTMDDEKSCTATFEACANLPARIMEASEYYSTLQGAYDESFDGYTIQNQTTVFTEALNIDKNKSVALESGYDCDYTTNTGITTLLGDITISNGTLIIQSGTFKVR